MGIDLHNLNFLAHAQDRGVNFDNTLAIGRQAVFVEPKSLEKHRALRGLPRLRDGTPPEHLLYFEPLLQQWLGARVTDSVDASPYEQARFIHDMNLPWPADAPERGRYDAVLDFGCLEHVFNFPVAWRNCVDLCRDGGHLLHALPANNLAGHGFYQFSPELFFNLYRREHGFELLDLFFAVKTDESRWWRVANPMKVKRRVTLCHAHEVYMLVLARKLRDPGVLPAPQQSDYAQGDWVGNAGNATASNTRRRALDVLDRIGLREVARAGRARLAALRRSGMALPPPDYTCVPIDALIRRCPKR